MLLQASARMNALRTVLKAEQEGGPDFLRPDLNDGVVLNIAPLWELEPRKKAKGYWDELLPEEYSDRRWASCCGRRDW